MLTEGDDCIVCGKTITSLSTASRMTINSPACVIGESLAKDLLDIRNEPFTSMNGEILIITHAPNPPTPEPEKDTTLDPEDLPKPEGTQSMKGDEE